MALSTLPQQPTASSFEAAQAAQIDGGHSPSLGRAPQPDRGMIPSPMEELSLIRRAQAGDSAARERIIEMNMRLVYSVARRYHCRSLTLDDLVQEGVIGLLVAVDRFDTEFGCRLSTYATHWIRQSITRAIEQHDRLIRLPVQAATELRQLQQARQRLQQRLQREPDLEELAAECDLAHERVAQLLGTCEPVSLDTLLGPDQELALGDVAVDESATDPEEGTLADAGALEVRRALETLDPKERRILELRYGFSGEGPKSLQEMSEYLGISREGIRQIEVKALKRLRRLLHASQWD